MHADFKVIPVLVAQSIDGCSVQANNTISSIQAIKLCSRMA